MKWLQQVKKETGLLTAVEVANADHVNLAIKHDIDILWIGARTTSNPFSVQELADLLKGYDKPVLVKNPINPDVNLWVGALERFHKAGIDKLAAVHRGFYPLRLHHYEIFLNGKCQSSLKVGVTIYQLFAIQAILLVAENIFLRFRKKHLT